MNDQTQLLLSKIKEEMDKQTETITKAVLKQMDDKLKPIVEENLRLKNEVEILNEKVKRLETGKKINNLIFFGFRDSEKDDNPDLIDVVTKTLKESGIDICKKDINNAFRVGKAGEKPRPVLVNMLNAWKKYEILRNKKLLPKNIFVNEDFSKEVLEKRKELLPQLEEERKKGRIAYIKYDKLIVKSETSVARDKRKREPSTSPHTATGSVPLKLNKVNAFELMYRNKQTGTTNVSNTKEQ